MTYDRRTTRDRARLDQLERQIIDHLRELAALALGTEWRSDYMPRDEFVRLLAEWAFAEFTLRNR